MPEPNSSTTNQLAQVTESLRNLWERGPEVTDLPEFDQLVTMRSSLEDQLRLRPSSQQVVDFLDQGDVAAATATIEGTGSTQTVLDEYLWTLLDIAYLGRDGEIFTSDHLGDFMAIAGPATTYVGTVLAGLPNSGLTPAELTMKERCAEILHNIASFTLPDDGLASPADMAAGLSAALRALQVREELGDTATIMRANWMVGNHYRKVDDLDKAEQHLTTAVNLADTLADPVGIAWGKTYLADVKRAQDPSTASRLESEAGEAMGQVEDENFMIEWLRIQQRIGA